MATIASLMVNLGLNSAAFDSGLEGARSRAWSFSKQMKSGLKVGTIGMIQDFQAADRGLVSMQNSVRVLGDRLTSATRPLIGLMIGGSIFMGIKSVLTQVQTALKTPEGIEKFSQAFNVDPSRMRAAAEAMDAVQQAVKQTIVNGVATIAPAIVGISQSLQSAVFWFKQLAETNLYNVTTLGRLVISGYVFTKMLGVASIAIKGIISAYRAWASASVFLQAVSGVGLAKVLVAIGLAAGATIALNIAWDRMVDAGNAASVSAINFADAQDEVVASTKAGTEAVSEVDEALRRASQRYSELYFQQKGYSAAQARILAMGTGNRTNLLLQAEGRNQEIEDYLEAGKASTVFLKNLRDEVALRNLNRSALIREKAQRLANVPGGGMDLAEVEKLITVLEGFETAKKKLEEAAAAMTKIENAAQSIYQSTRTPFENLTSKLDDLNALLNIGMLSWDTYGRAVRGAMGEYGRAAGGGGFGTYRLGNPLISIESMKTGVGGKTALNVLQELREAGKLDTGLFKRIAAAVEAPAA